jgi:hypothetical protein
MTGIKRSLLGYLTVIGVVLALAVPALGGGRPFSTELSGDNEVQAPGSEATGTAHLTLNQGLGEICADIQSSGYEEGEVILAGHIHVGPVGVDGPIVVNLFVASANHSICVDVDTALIKDIRQNPGDYYVNLHSNLRPTGVIRGQLSK